MNLDLKLERQAIHMKRIILTAALLLPLVSIAAEENKVSVSGQFRIRAEGDERTDFISNRDFSVLRIRPIVKFTRDSSLDAVFTPQFSKTLGEPTYTVPVTTGTNTRTGTSGVTYDPSLGVHEAYADYHPSDWFAFRAGRMVLSYGDELVIGALDWNNIGRSFDGFRTRFTLGAGSLDVFATKITDNNTVANTAGDVDFYGIYNHLDLGEQLKNFDLYLLYQQDATAATPTQLGAAGARAASKIDAFDYRAEYTKEFGNIFADTSAYQMDGEVGYTFDHSIKPRLGFEYFYAGKLYSQLYPTAHKWLGYADVLGRRNLSGFVIHSEVQATKEMKVRFDFHRFNRADSSASVFKVNGATALGTAAGSSSNSVGSEFDLTVPYQVTKDLCFTGGASLFRADTYLKDQFGDLNPTFYYLQMEVKL